MAIAEGLETAHDKGVIHRDLKPANLKITPDGTPKILDFGLAKALQTQSVAHGSSSHSPTLTKGTAVGTVMGTAAYMSPEQARGKPVDRRADIWAFGVVLHETLSGRKLFKGETVSDTLAAVLRAEVKWNALPSETPAGVRRVLRRCLSRDPKTRLQHIGDARLELGERDDAAPTSAPSGRLQLRHLAAAAVCGMALIAFLAASFWPSLPSPRVVEFEIAPPDEISPMSRPVVSPDGSTIAFVAAQEGVSGIYVRAVDGVGIAPIENTEHSRAPIFWSPDSNDLAFFC